MGLLQKAVETYDAYSEFIVAEIEGHEMLVPVSHILTRAEIEITLEDDGGFCSARLVDKKEPKIAIPATEESAGRTSSPCAHPLCDQLCYICDYNEKKHGLYINQLTRWANSEYSHPMLLPILKYVESKTVLSDLKNSGIIKLNDKGIPENEKMIVRWRVHGIKTPKDGCWQQKSLFKAFGDWYSSIQNFDKRSLCMITGNNEITTGNHPKGIVSIKGNAKLISANDSSGFTFRGRFTDQSQAATVGYIASQKAHNALRWIVAEQGAIFGDRVFLCWSPQGVKICHAAGPFGDKSKVITKPSDYQDELKNTLKGYMSELPEKNSTVVIAALDAATTGRLSITYYNELMDSDYLNRLHNWDKHCCWYYKKYINSPTLSAIVNCAFGKVMTENGKEVLKTDTKVFGQHMQRLISCRVDGMCIPFDIMKALINRASSPLGYEKVWDKILSTTCAVIKKYRYDYYKEEYEMELKPEKTDRSYQFGRLIAVFEKVEKDTYNNGEDRDTYAIRMMNVFHRRPLFIANDIEKHLERAYFGRLKPQSRIYYKKLIGEILEEIYKFPQEEWNNPLSETYLMGYYLQRNDLYKSKKEVKTEEEVKL